MTNWKEAEKSERQGNCGAIIIFILLLILGIGLASGGDNDTGQGCRYSWISDTTYCN